MQTQKHSLLTQRGQMALVGLSLWALLAMWSLAAFWQHIDELKPTYPLITKLGAGAGEVALLALILWHCFNKHIGVRKWSLIFSLILSAGILVHAGALRGMAEAQTVQVDAEKRLEDGLTRMSKEQMGQTKRRADVAKSAQKELADTVRAGNDKVKNSSILPRWYVDGWMYSVLFIMSLVAVGAVTWMLTNRHDIDANFDGIPDRLQEPNVLAKIVEPSEFPDAVPTGPLEEARPKELRR